MSKTSHAKNGGFIVDTSRLSAGLWNIYILYMNIYIYIFIYLYMYNYVYLTIGFIVDTSIHSGGLWCIYICALNCRIYGRLSTSSAVEFMVDDAPED